MQKRLCILIFGTVFFAHAFSFGGTGFNELSRLDLLHAIVYEHRMTIDTFHDNTGDKAFFDGHYYSEKPPGVALLALPAFTLSAWLSGVLGLPYLSAEALMFKTWIATVGSVGVLAAVAAVAMFLMLCKFVDAPSSLLTTGVLFLASPMFTYSHVLFAHGAAASLLTIAWWALLTRTQHTAGWKGVVAGVCAGLAITCEFVAGIAVAVMFLYCLSQQWRLAWQFACSAVWPLLIIPVHNYLIFGNFFSLGYNVVPGIELRHPTLLQNLRIGTPDPAIIIELLFMGKRGLLFWTPLLWLVVPGVLLLRKQEPILAYLSVASSVLLVLFVAGLGVYWHGGWALGPRQLTSMLPILSLPLAFGCCHSPRIAGLLGVFSWFFTYVAAVVDPRTAPIDSPLWSYYIPQYLHGNFGTNWLVLLGANGTIVFILQVLFFLGIGALAYHWSRGKRVGRI